MKVNSIRLMCNSNLNNQHIQTQSKQHYSTNTNYTTQNIPNDVYIAYNNINFGYSHPIKTMFKEGFLPTVTKGLYGETLTVKNCSLEHIIPHSRNGKSSLTNYALASMSKNNARGSDPIYKHLTPKYAIEYLEQFRDLVIDCGRNKKLSGYKFNGNEYIKAVSKTLASEGVDVLGHFKDLK